MDYINQACNDRVISEDYADLIVEYQQIPDILKSITDICYHNINEKHAVSHIPVKIMSDNIIKTIGYNVLPTCFGIADIQSLNASNINRIRNSPNLNLSGEGVLIGIIDTGIDYTHNAFRNSDGTTRIVSIWDQTIQTGPRPTNINFGTEYTSEQINQALKGEVPLSIVPSNDTDGHGTLLAGIAGGTSNSENNFSGVATAAEFVIVKLKQAKRFIRDFFAIPYDSICFEENDIMFGVNYLISVANKLSRPISICIGLETSHGSHDGRGALSSYLSRVGNQGGVAVTVPAGNEGNRGHHYRGSININEFDNVELRVGPNVKNFIMELWGRAPGTYSIDILSPAGEYIPRIPARLDESRVIRFIFERTVIYVYYFLIESQSGDQLIFFRFENASEGLWRFKVYARGDITSNFDIWLPIQNFLNDDIFFLRPDPYYTTTSPGNAIVPIVATAYDYTNGSLYINASKGYTRTEHISPSIAAPGVNLIGPTFNQGYNTASGTSLSAAHTAGAAALIMEWGLQTGISKQLSSTEIKKFFVRGAKRSQTLTYPNRDWGYGILDLFNSFNSLRG